MLEEVIVAGFGGQGVMLIGQILAYSAIKSGLNATWVPSYGAEMRGGTANCLCVISTDEVGSPLVKNPTTFFCMNQPSMDKFGQSVKAGGLVIANKSLVSNSKVAQDVEVVEVPLKELALELGNSKVENMIMLGAYIAKKPMITIEGAIASFQAKIGEAKPQVISLNRKALEAGYNWVRDHYCD
jgi:2-oxoglutarate ferredoxin oxidoreductase subunit gamma